MDKIGMKKSKDQRKIAVPDSGIWNPMKKKNPIIFYFGKKKLDAITTAINQNKKNKNKTI